MVDAHSGCALQRTYVTNSPIKRRVAWTECTGEHTAPRGSFMIRIYICHIPAALAVILTLGFASGLCRAADMPGHMDIVTKHSGPLSKVQIAHKNVVALNDIKFSIYADALETYKRNLLAQHPVILALFSSEGGRLILYRPGQEPLTAEPPTVNYQILKAVAHSSMAIFQLVGPSLADPANQAWRGPMASYRTTNQTALDSLDALDISNEVRDNLRNILHGNLKFMDACLNKGSFTYEDLKQYTQEVKPFLAKNIWWDADLQVKHWMNVVKAWKDMLGQDWEKTYGVTNSLYVTRQNNILYSVLAQFFGKEALNTRLFLFETSSFTTTPNQMLEVLTRTVADRSVGEVFFGNYYLMDYELMGGAARKVIEDEDKKLGLNVFLPPLVPFHSNEWPWKTDPSQGEGPATLEQIK